MFAFDSPIGAGDGGLDVAERYVDPLEGWRASRGGTATCDDGLVGTARIGHATEAAQAIGRQHRLDTAEEKLPCGQSESFTSNRGRRRCAIRGEGAL